MELPYHLLPERAQRFVRRRVVLAAGGVSFDVVLHESVSDTRLLPRSNQEKVWYPWVSRENPFDFAHGKFSRRKELLFGMTSKLLHEQ